MLGGVVRRDPCHLLEIDPTHEDAAEIDGHEQQQEQDRQDERELDEALAARARAAA
jgi:hypothetical protein